jgi:ferritin-like metal-binding protein YciE
MKIRELSDVFEHELKDIYDAEHQITQALPKMKKAASSADLQKALDQHLEQTKGHIERLEKVFDMVGVSADRKTCKGMKGIISEGEELIKENDPCEALDAALITAAQRVEHYEIAAYGALRNYAMRLDHADAAELLQQTLDQEGETNKKLTKLAEKINPKAKA